MASDETATETPHLVADQSEVAAFLEDPASHGGRPVERIDTHAAMVFLAGERAYKVKRAVKYAYMDFSTLERRKWACEREIAFNRRTAPTLYLRALPIARADNGGLNLGGSGEAVEWCVEMSRFDQASLFDRMAQDGRLSADLMAELTDVVVAFHADAETLDPETAPQSGAEDFRWAFEQNLDELADRPDLFPPDALARLSKAGRALLSRSEPLLDQRLRDGRVRRCHGDLHLRNICLVDGAPTLFDCIEFNDDLACIDVLYDLAFLLMDLEHRRLGGFANLVFNRYLARTGDLDGLDVLPLFLVARALVRAKVSASAEASQEDAEARAALEQEARAYFAEAAGHLEPATPSLAAVGGLSGTGKTTLARALAPDLGAPPGALHLRSDVIRKELWGVGELETLPPEAYEAAAGERVYGAILQRAGQALEAGCAVIVDAVYARPAERDALEGLARRLGVAFRGVWLAAPAGTLVERVERRAEVAKDASDATAAVVRTQLDYDTGPIGWRRIDAGGTPEEVVRAARAALRLGTTP